MEMISEFTAETRGHVCSVCGAARRTEDVVIRLEYIDMEGWFDICSTCVTEMGDMIGLVSEDKVKKMSQELQKLQAMVDSLSMRIDDGKRALTR